MKRKSYIFALIAGMIAVISFIAVIVIFRNTSFTPWVKGRILAFPSACFIAMVIALYVARVWDE